MVKFLVSVVPILVVLQLKLVFSGVTVHNPAEQDADAKHNVLMENLQYSKYLKEVLELLETDNAMKNKSEFDTLSTGNLADHLGKASDNVRNKLDELKRHELQRIRYLSDELKRRGQNEKAIRQTVKAVTRHLDLKDLAKFGTEDLRKLLLQANAEIAILDAQRRERFKEYEMHKALEFEELYRRLSPKEKEEVDKNKAELLAEHKRKKPSHMPASKEHLMKVWEERDKLGRDNFNVKTFFHLHDLDGNGFLDEYEINLLLENEILDYHDDAAPDFDPKERDEDMQRMREYAFNKIDINKDHLISLDEFILNSKKTGYDDHVFWESVRNVPVYTEQEYAAYAVIHRAEVNRLIDSGRIELPPTGLVRHYPNLGKVMMRKFNVGPKIINEKDL